MKLFCQAAHLRGIHSSDPEIRSAAWRIYKALLEADLKEETKAHLIESKMEGESCSLQQFAWEVLDNRSLGGEERAQAAHFITAIIKTKRLALRYALAYPKQRVLDEMCQGG